MSQETRSGTERFQSILFRRPDDGGARDTHEAPTFFRDLNLDQIVAAVTAGWRDYDLTPFFHASLSDLDLIAYRQEVMRDLENNPVMHAVRAFSEQMRVMRRRLTRAEKSHYTYEKERWFLGAVELYCEAVERLRAASISAIWHHVACAPSANTSPSTSDPQSSVNSSQTRGR